MLPYDTSTGWPSTRDTFLRLAAQLGLYTKPSQVEQKHDHTLLKLGHTTYGGTLCFYPDKKGKITIGQSDLRRKEQLWWLLQPHTWECDERPAKRAKKAPQRPQQGQSSIPTPEYLMQQETRTVRPRAERQFCGTGAVQQSTAVGFCSLLCKEWVGTRTNRTVCMQGPSASSRCQKCIPFRAWR